MPSAAPARPAPPDTSRDGADTPRRVRLPAVLADPVGRIVGAAAAASGLANWTLFALLVGIVDTLTDGSPWATTAVIASRLAPGVLLAPLAARLADGRDARTVLACHETLRAAAVATIAAAAAAGSLPLAAIGLLTLEYAASLIAAAGESVVSIRMRPALFTPMNTLTAVASYGLLPVGAAAAAVLPSAVAFPLLVAVPLAVAALWLRLPATAPSPVEPNAVARTTSQPASDHASNPASGPADGSLTRTVVAAAVGLVPAVVLFTLAPGLAEGWLGDRAATVVPYVLVLAGAAAGFAAANLTAAPTFAMLAVATAGTVLTTTGLWPAGLLGVGVGAGAAYLRLQTRLQHQACDPSQFAAAFAALKVSVGLAAVGAPAVAGIAGNTSAMLAAAVCAAAATCICVPQPRRQLAAAARALARGLLLGIVLRLLVHVDTRSHAPRKGGPCVVVSNHPHWLDGPAVVFADRTLRPIARWQRNRLARLGIWAGGCVVTTAQTGRDARPAYQQAADHLRDGGRIWLAPEGGSHQDTALSAPRSGAVRMAHAASVPVQPLAVLWSDSYDGPQLSRWRPWRRPTVTLVWGRPVATTGDVDADNDAMMRSLADAGTLTWDPTTAVPLRQRAADSLQPSGRGAAA